MLSWQIGAVMPEPGGSFFGKERLHHLTQPLRKYGFRRLVNLRHCPPGKRLHGLPLCIGQARNGECSIAIVPPDIEHVTVLHPRSAMVELRRHCVHRSGQSQGQAQLFAKFPFCRCVIRFPLLNLAAGRSPEREGLSVPLDVKTDKQDPVLPVQQNDAGGFPQRRRKGGRSSFSPSFQTLSIIINTFA